MKKKAQNHLFGMIQSVFSLTVITYAYVTYQDIRSIRSLDEQTVIAIKAPPETRLEVPDPGENIQIWLKVC